LVQPRSAILGGLMSLPEHPHPDLLLCVNDLTFQARVYAPQNRRYLLEPSRNCNFFLMELRPRELTLLTDLSAIAPCVPCFEVRRSDASEIEES